MKYKDIINRVKSAHQIPYSKYKQFIDYSSEENANQLVALSIIYDTPVEALENLNPIEIEALTSNLMQIFNAEQSIVYRFKHNNIEFGLIPDFSKITAKELIDLDTFLQQKDIPAILAILYRPIIKKQWNPFHIFGKTERYKIEKYTDLNDDLFKDVPISFVNGALDFFLTFYQSLN